MKPSPRTHAPTWPSIILLALAIACSSREPNQGAGGPSGASDYVSSACGQCFKSECGAELAACDAASDCAQGLACLERCPLAGLDVEPTCAESCATSDAIYAALDKCRTRVSTRKACAEACGAQLDDPDDPEPVPPYLHQSCPEAPQPTECATCRMESCCEVVDACDHEPTCDDYGNCLRECDSAPDCRERCGKEFPSGSRPYLEKLTCLNYSCGHLSDACVAEHPCVDCLWGSCTASFADCQADAACTVLQFCVAQCDKESCIGDCFASYPEGVARFRKWNDCMLANCLSTCS